MDNKAHFEIDWKGENISLYWDTIPRPIEIKKLPSGFWAVVIGTEQKVQFYPTERLAKMALAEIVLGKLHDQFSKICELFDTLESEGKMEMK